MALLNEILAARYNALLSRLLGIQGPAPAPQLASDITPAIILESDRPEFLYLGGQRPWAARLTQNASVGNISVVQLFNPAASGVIDVIEKIVIDVGAAGVVYVAWYDTQLGNPSDWVLAFLDRRQGTVSQVPTIVQGGSNPAALVGQTWFGSDLLALTPFTLDFSKVAGPVMNQGTGIIVETGAANVSLRVAVIGRERALFSTET